MTNRIVFLDAGHGSTDPGATGNGLQEKNIVLEVARRCENYLTTNFNNVTVRQTRTTDTFVTLQERTNQANTAGADIFLSFHCNGFHLDTANGFESYIQPGSGNETIRLQQAIHSRLARFYGEVGLRDRGMRQLNLHVLRESNMPAVLTENLFMSNREILNFNNDEFMQSVAEAHAEGIAEFLELSRKNLLQSSSNTHTVARGETLTSIARQHNVTVNAIVQANNLVNPNRISVGQRLTIPTGPAPAQQFFPVTQSGGTSIVDALRAINVDTSFANRQGIAVANGINNFTGASAQNSQMLSLLRQGRLVRP